MRSEGAYANHHIVIVAQDLTDSNRNKVRARINDFDDVVNADLDLDREDVKMDLQTASLLLVDPATKVANSQQVALIHVNVGCAVTPMNEDEAAILQKDIIPELEFNQIEEDDLAVTVVRPLCHETGMGEWADNLFEEKDKRELVPQVQMFIRDGKEGRDLPVRLIPDRHYKLHGKEQEEAKLKAIITVPRAEVELQLAKSGRNGISVEPADRQQSVEMRKIKLPRDCALPDAFVAIASTPASRRKPWASYPQPEAMQCAAITRQKPSVPELSTQLWPRRWAQPLGFAQTRHGC